MYVLEQKNIVEVLQTRCQVVMVDNLNPFQPYGWGVQLGGEDESLILCLVLHHCLANPHPCTDNYTTLDLSSLIQFIIEYFLMKVKTM